MEGGGGGERIRNPQRIFEAHLLEKSFTWKILNQNTFSIIYNVVDNKEKINTEYASIHASSANLRNFLTDLYMVMIFTALKDGEKQHPEIFIFSTRAKKMLFVISGSCAQLHVV